ncbi:hypothetical protein BDN72DRAFT_848587 [Pluteus cervinus]|uniref:Uncharacterized protein n=1 Tax=Pluteus cervinus TaxID=181527 RepID=A0ACD3A9J2_9AGAR|nr:hypothetical protein BDN72DRAFT_848587 [Pluteus cervinus]
MRTRRTRGAQLLVHSRFDTSAKRYLSILYCHACAMLTLIVAPIVFRGLRM